MSAPTSEEVACIDCRPDASHPSTLHPTSAPTASTTDPLLDPSTFIPPLAAPSLSGIPTPLVVIEYCQRCKFGLRANWVQQELLSTFAPLPPGSDERGASVASVMVVPKVDDASSGRFRVWIHTDSTANEQNHANLQLVWDRKVQGGFPEMKVLKQKIRDHINPSFGLGHSDKK